VRFTAKRVARIHVAYHQRETVLLILQSNCPHSPPPRTLLEAVAAFFRHPGYTPDGATVAFTNPKKLLEKLLRPISLITSAYCDKGTAESL
jgi:hypothetical protein